MSVACASISQVSILDVEGQDNPRTLDRVGVRCLAYNHTGRVLAMADSGGQVSLYDTESFQLLGELGPSTTQMSFLSRISFSKGSKLLALAGSSKDVLLFDMRTQAVSKSLRGHSHALTSIILSANDDYAASASTSGDVKVHSLASSLESCRLDPIDSVPKSHLTFLQESAQQVAAGGDRTGSLYVWDVFASSTVAHFPRSHTGKITGLLPLNDASGGSALFSTGLDRQMVLTDLRSRGAAMRAETPFPPTCLAAREGTGQLAVGTAPGVVLLYDFRDLSKPLASRSLFQSSVVDIVFKRDPLSSKVAASPAKKEPSKSAQSTPTKADPTAAILAAVKSASAAALPPKKDSAAPPSAQPKPAPVPAPAPAPVAAPKPPAPSPVIASRPIDPFASEPAPPLTHTHSGALEDPSGDPLMTSFRGINQLLELGRSMDAATASMALGQTQRAATATTATPAAAPTAPSVENAAPSSYHQTGFPHTSNAGPLSRQAQPTSRIEDELAMGGGAAGGQMLQTISEGNEDAMTESTPPRSLGNTRELHHQANHTAGGGGPGYLGASRHLEPVGPGSTLGSGSTLASVGFGKSELTEFIRFTVKQAIAEATSAIRDDLRELQLDAIRSHVELTEQLQELARRQDLILKELAASRGVRPGSSGFANGALSSMRMSRQLAGLGFSSSDANGV